MTDVHIHYVYVHCRRDVMIGEQITSFEPVKLPIGWIIGIPLLLFTSVSPNLMETDNKLSFDLFGGI